MTVAELIEKLSVLPPSTEVVTDDNYAPLNSPDLYLIQCHVERYENSTWFNPYLNERDDLKTVVLITMFGQDEDEAVRL